MATSGGTNGAGTIFKISTTGTFKVIKHLAAATNGSNPEGNLVKGAGGVDSFLYGTTRSRIFKISPNGSIFTVLKTLRASTDGDHPVGSLLSAADGNFWDTQIAPRFPKSSFPGRYQNALQGSSEGSTFAAESR